MDSKEAQSRNEPHFSFIVPVYRPPLRHLERCLKSLLAQTFTSYEVILAPDGPQPGDVMDLLRRFESRCPGVVVVAPGDDRAGISAASNRAAGAARGKWLVFVDHDDLVHPAMLERMSAFSGQDAALLYTDEDKLIGPVYHTPFVKPDASLHNIMACNYYSHCRAIRRTVLEQTGGHDSRFDGSQDYELELRVIKAGFRAVRVPGIFYHWRMSFQSTALRPGAKPQAYSAAMRALELAFPDREFREVENQPGFYLWRMRHAGELTFYGVTRQGVQELTWRNGAMQGIKPRDRLPAGDEDRFVLHAPMFEMESLRSSGFLDRVGGYLDPAAATVSFRIGAAREVLAGGINAFEGHLWYAGARRHMGLHRVAWECCHPNPFLFAAPLRQYRRLVLPAGLPDIGSYLGGLPADEAAVHLDVPVSVARPADMKASAFRLPSSVPGLPDRKRHHDYMGFIRTRR